MRLRWLLVVALCAPALAAARTAAESEALMRDRIAPKLDLMCGTHLDVHYDVASLGTIDVEATCEAPLRLLYYACQTGEARRAIQLAHLRRYECRGLSRSHSKIAVDHGTVALDVDVHDADVERRIDELARILFPQVTLYGDADRVATSRERDKKWDAFVAAPVPVPTATDFCIVGDKKIALPPTGDPLAPPHVHVQCVHGGKVVTEMSADGTGFVTRLEGNRTRFDSYKLGRPDGESWVREKGLLMLQTLVVEGREVQRTEYYAPGKLRGHYNLAGDASSAIDFDPHGGVTRLYCGDQAPNDVLLRGYCGYDAPRKLRITEPGNERTVIMTNGKARLVE